MSQSKTTYGAELPKGTARSRRAEHDNQTETADDSDTVEPACRTRKVGRGVDRREWREMPYDGRTRTFYDPCEWPECYPDGPPDDETETVIRSCRKPTSYHRPREDGEPCEYEADAPETNTDSTHISRDAIEPIGAISLLTDLQEGHRVIWESRTYPLRVTATASKLDGTIGLCGPSGGEYQIEGRPEYRQPYYLSGYGYLSEIIRVRARTRAERI
ncbi:hypothetical protein GCM10008985_15870 [Halococcus dombrowskii]|uniref:Uncharacterized protein n=1 Tax=Halococcus dombrowskii TaxID=179637 RepID=A0AAV3SFR3_HALDO